MKSAAVAWLATMPWPDTPFSTASSWAPGSCEVGTGSVSVFLIKAYFFFFFIHFVKHSSVRYFFAASQDNTDMAGFRFQSTKLESNPGPFRGLHKRAVDHGPILIALTLIHAAKGHKRLSLKLFKQTNSSYY